MDRYSRQILLPEIGGIGQKKLGKSSVGLVGANSISQPFFLYGVGAGVGKWGLLDPSLSSANNLAFQAKSRNPNIEVRVYSPKNLKEDIESWVKQWSIVIDASNNHVIQQKLTSACQLTRTPIISAGCDGSTGWILQAPCPFCLTSTPPLHSTKNQKNWVENMVPGLIGSILAQHAILFLLKPPKIASPQLTNFTADTYTLLNKIPYKDPNCPTCHITS
ncbi:MAG: ThiF family adenylyltransferase [Magnetococcales bacterium]|nr:ThiF family adenylyltransferase [Magnetococcales bacterium]